MHEIQREGYGLPREMCEIPREGYGLQREGYGLQPVHLVDTIGLGFSP
jgi:hypothetical protein